MAAQPQLICFVFGSRVYFTEFKRKHRPFRVGFIDYVFSFNQHKREVVDDEVRESLTFSVCSKSHITKDNPVGEIKLKNNKIYIKETYFPNVLSSEKAKEIRKTERNQALLEMAKSQMRGIEMPEQ